MYGPMTQVNEFLRMTRSEVRVVAEMACIRTGRGVARRESEGKRGVGDRACPSTVSYRQKLAVPAAQRQPDFSLNIRVARGCECRCNAAERRQVDERVCCRAPIQLYECSSVDNVRRINVCIRQWHSGELIARRSGSG